MGSGIKQTTAQTLVTLERPPKAVQAPDLTRTGERESTQIRKLPVQYRDGRRWGSRGTAVSQCSPWHAQKYTTNSRAFKTEDITQRSKQG